MLYRSFSYIPNKDEQTCELILENQPNQRNTDFRILTAQTTEADACIIYALLY